MRTSARLFIQDIRNLNNDPMTFLITVLPPVLGLFFRFFFPWLDRMLTEYFLFTLVPYYPMVTAVAILMPPVLAGWVAGTIILDEKDQGLDMVFSVTPLTVPTYIMVRLFWPGIFSIPMGLLMIALMNLTEPFHPLYPLLLLQASLEAPLVTLFLAVFARNKVQGLTLAKSLNLLMVIPILPLFVPAPWFFLGGIVPMFWSSFAFYTLFTGKEGVPIYFIAGMAVHLLFIILLYRMYKKRRGTAN